MKILMVNKFLYPNGGSETYLLQLGEALVKQGHEVQYFGMEHEGRCVGNAVNAYTTDMDFHGGRKLDALLYPLKTVYSAEARKKIRLVLNHFQPDAVHLNNFNYQLTPSIILEIRKWEKKTRHPIKIVYTAHDYQLLCPNHRMNNLQTGKNCEKCVGGNFVNCIKGRCIHGSYAKSVIGAVEGYFWAATGVYRQLDAIVCPTRFMKTKMDTNPLFARKTVAMLNFADQAEDGTVEKKDYIIYFGRYSEEKGIRTLISVCRELPQLQFVFAGSGPLEKEINDVPNVRNVGFQKGAALAKLIREARFSVYPSEWYENCPLSVMESLMCGTPVLGANIGGIPELIHVGMAGELFESGNAVDLKAVIEIMYRSIERNEKYSRNTKFIRFDTPEAYCDKLLNIFQCGLHQP
jgi:glycosyltransferase involved in cell wall biosynthesis